MRKTIALVFVVTLTASACQGLGSGESATKTCAVGQTASWITLDNNGVGVMCGTELVETYVCAEDSFPGVDQNLNEITVLCVPDVTGDEIAEFDVIAPEDDLESAAIYCSGGRGWTKTITYGDFTGWVDDTAGGYNWIVGMDYTWCVRGGLVVGGLTAIPWEHIYNKLMYEEGPGAEVWASPANMVKRQIRTDWDFGWGRCPYCINVDIDYNIYVDNRNPSHIWGTMRHNGDGV